MIAAHHLSENIFKNMYVLSAHVVKKAFLSLLKYKDSDTSFLKLEESKSIIVSKFTDLVRKAFQQLA